MTHQNDGNNNLARQCKFMCKKTNWKEKNIPFGWEFCRGLFLWQASPDPWHTGPSERGPEWPRCDPEGVVLHHCAGSDFRLCSRAQLTEAGTQPEASGVLAHTDPYKMASPVQLGYSLCKERGKIIVNKKDGLVHPKKFFVIHISSCWCRDMFSCYYKLYFYIHPLFLLEL